MVSFDDVCDTLRANRKCMIIEAGDYGYSYFNVAYVCNMLALILYSLYNNCVPVIRMNQDMEECNQWQWFFDEPHVVMGIDISGFKEIICEIKNYEQRPSMIMLFDDQRELKFWQFMARRFMRLNQNTLKYIEEEQRCIGRSEEMLGVLIRGTDYVTLKPSGHPVQPDPQEIIEMCRKKLTETAYSGVYVATDEKTLFDLVKVNFGEHMVHENRRRYYDELYYQSGVDLIGKVHFQRENDNYWKSIEYLSSLIILSKCKTLVAGNCGGTLFAMLMADYHDPYIFDYGVYE